jgi:hypothetical protein
MQNVYVLKKIFISDAPGKLAEISAARLLGGIFAFKSIAYP